MLEPPTDPPKTTTSQPWRAICACSSRIAAPPDFLEPPTLAHGRLESRSTWTTTVFNDYLDFPRVGQGFAIKRQTIEKNNGKLSNEATYGVTSHTSQSADVARLLAFNRHRSRVESHHYILDENRCTLRIGHGPANITSPRRFAVGLTNSKSRDSVAATSRRQLARTVRVVFDYLRTSNNSNSRLRLT